MQNSLIKCFPEHTQQRVSGAVPRICAHPAVPSRGKLGPPDLSFSSVAGGVLVSIIARIPHERTPERTRVSARTPAMHQQLIKNVYIDPLGGCLVAEELLLPTSYQPMPACGKGQFGREKSILRSACRFEYVRIAACKTLPHVWMKATDTLHEKWRLNRNCCCNLLRSPFQSESELVASSPELSGVS